MTMPKGPGYPLVLLAPTSLWGTAPIPIALVTNTYYWFIINESFTILNNVYNERIKTSYRNL